MGQWSVVGGRGEKAAGQRTEDGGQRGVEYDPDSDPDPDFDIDWEGRGMTI